MPTIEQVRGQFHRRKLMLQCKHVPLRQRLVQQLTLHPSPRAYFREMIAREGGRFRFCHSGVDLVSSPLAGCDATTAANGFALVVAEMYALPMLYSEKVRPSLGATALDLGANIGTTAFVLAQSVGPQGRVYAFEPITHETIALNVSKNRLHNVQVVPVAVGALCGEVEMVVNPFTPASRIAYGLDDESMDYPRRTVRLVALDDWCESEKLDRVDFIKMDVEGVEEDVIRGAERLIRRCHPLWSISSEHIDASGEHQHRKLVALLGSFGYHIKEIGQLYIYAWHQ